MRILFVAAAVALAGCSSSDPPAPAAPSNDAIVSAWAKTFCERLFECAPGEKERGYRGSDAASCTRIQIDSMTRALNAPGAPKTLSKLQKCTEQLRPLSCQNVMDVLITYDFVTAPDCMTLDPGEVPVGGACVYGAQCASGKCSPADGTCGHCVAVAADGDPCTVVSFAPDVCDSAHGSGCVRGVCKKIPHIGEPCTETCAGYSTCHAVSHSCVALQQTRGATCDPNSGDCDTVGQQLVCSNTTNSCERMEIVKEGDVCGLGIPSGGWAQCAEGLLCDMSKPATANPASGHCVRSTVGKLGDACVALGDIYQHGCEAETRCVSGVCGVDDPATCK